MSSLSTLPGHSSIVKKTIHLIIPRQGHFHHQSTLGFPHARLTTVLHSQLSHWSPIKQFLSEQPHVSCTNHRSFSYQSLPFVFSTLSTNLHQSTTLHLYCHKNLYTAVSLSQRFRTSPNRRLQAAFLNRFFSPSNDFLTISGTGHLHSQQSYFSINIRRSLS